MKKNSSIQQPLIGIVQTISSPELTEILSLSDLDWIFIDMEHGSIGLHNLQILLQSAGEKPCAVRVPALEDVWIKKTLDAGARGIIIPQINSRADAQRAVELIKYPPEGSRSCGIGRAQQYGKTMPEYFQSANKDIYTIIQIEHIEGVNNIDSILNVEGIDCLFVGPYDLAASMNHLGDPSHDEVIEAIDKVREAVSQTDHMLGIFTTDAKAVESLIDKGFGLIALGMDSLLIQKAVSDQLSAIPAKRSNR